MITKDPTYRAIHRAAITRRLERLGDTWLPRSIVRSWVPGAVYAGDCGSLAEIGASEAGLASWARCRVAKRPSIVVNTNGLGREQADAIQCITKERISIITGGPGTGKTTAISRIVSAYLDEDLGVALVSPTGKGAVQLSASCDAPATTVHSLVNRNGSAIPESLIVVDEAGMLDVQIAYQLSRIVGEDTKIVFMGDCDQLPSVGPGNVLEDLCHTPIPRWHLNETYRYAAGGPLAAACHDVLSGNMPRTDERGREGFHLVDSATPFPTIYQALRSAMRRFGVSIYDCRVLCPYRKHAWALAHYIKQRINPSTTPLCAGDPIVNLHNEYDDDGEMIVANGEIGIVERTGFARFGDKLINPNDIDWSLAYASTVHKAQGGEWPVVILYIPEGRGWGFLTRELLHTGISRATRVCLTICNERTMRLAVSQQTRRRRTLLRQFYNGLQIAQ